MARRARHDCLGVGTTLPNVNAHPQNEPTKVTYRERFCANTGLCLHSDDTVRLLFVCSFVRSFVGGTSGFPQMSDLLLARTYSELEAQVSNKLLTVVETGTVDEVRSVLAKIQGSEKSVLTASSLASDHGQRTPFMAAVRRGDLAIFTALLHYFDRLFSNDVRGGRGCVWRMVVLRVVHVGSRPCLRKDETGNRT